MSLPLRPGRGGFTRAVGCGSFIWGFLSGYGPNGTPQIDPAQGACQADLFYWYKKALLQTRAENEGIRTEERRARQQRRAYDPDQASLLIQKYTEQAPYKSLGCRYHSFVTYFSNLQRLGWVEPSGIEEPSAFQKNYPQGQPRKFFRLTQAGRNASESQWANPYKALYGQSN